MTAFEGARVRAGLGLTALRIWVGLGFLVAAWDKLRRENGYGRSLRFLIDNVYGEAAYGFYQTFLTNVVYPNADLFAAMVSWGELLVGLALVVGLLAVPAALGGMFIVLNIFLATGASPWLLSVDLMYAAALVAIAFGKGGQYWGLDGVLAPAFEPEASLPDGGGDDLPDAR